MFQHTYMGIFPEKKVVKNSEKYCVSLYNKNGEIRKYQSPSVNVSC